MRIFMNHEFKKWLYKQRIKENEITKAVIEMEKGLHGVNLGGNVYKKRLVYCGKGKRGGIRTIIAFRIHEKAFFMYAFAKSKLDNISDKELEALKSLAKVYLNLTNDQISQAVLNGDLTEIQYEKINP